MRATLGSMAVPSAELPSTTYDERRLAQTPRMLERAGPLIAQVDWSRERLADHRRELLRNLVRHARTHSPWHAQRLADLDPDTLGEKDLAAVPSMSKGDLMDNWDAIVTDPRLSLARCEAHIEQLDRTGELVDLAGEHHVLASGGSSGRRGVFPFGWNELIDFYLSYARWLMRGLQLRSKFEDPMIFASVGASAPTHATSAVARVFRVEGQAAHSFPVGLPLAEIVEGLNRADPTILNTYASALNLLAHEALAGRLRIRPRWIWSTSEPLLPEIAELTERVWGIPPVNGYGTTDVGIMGSGCGLATGVHLNEDFLIVEPVDAAGEPVPPGTRAAKAYVTALTH